MRINCPYCGERDASEFTYLGDADLKRPGPGARRTPTARSSTTSISATIRRAAWPSSGITAAAAAPGSAWCATRAPTRSTSAALAKRGGEVAACARDARREPFRLASGGVDRPHAHAQLHLRRQELSRLSRRHAGLGAAGQRRAPGRALVQVSPAARHLSAPAPEEPNALVELRSGARREPNTRATTVELYDGLDAASQNRWPSLDFDLLAINRCFARSSARASTTRPSCGRRRSGRRSTSR